MLFFVVGLFGLFEFDVSVGGFDMVCIDNFFYDVFGVFEIYVDFGVDVGFMLISGLFNFNGGEFKVVLCYVEDFVGYVFGFGMEGILVEEFVFGDLVIIEVMYDLICLGDGCEWIEIYNVLGFEVNLFGLWIQDSVLFEVIQGVIMDDLVVVDGGYVVFG